MKKLLGVLVVVALCICMIVPAATAKGTESLSALLEGVDVGSLTDGELASILKGLDLDGIDTDSLKEALGADGSKIESAIKTLTQAKAMPRLTQVPTFSAEFQVFSAESIFQRSAECFQTPAQSPICSAVFSAAQVMLPVIRQAALTFPPSWTPSPVLSQVQDLILAH